MGATFIPAWQLPLLLDIPRRLSSYRSRHRHYSRPCRHACLQDKKSLPTNRNIVPHTLRNRQLPSCRADGRYMDQPPISLTASLHATLIKRMAICMASAQTVQRSTREGRTTGTNREGGRAWETEVLNFAIHPVAPGHQPRRISFRTAKYNGTSLFHSTSSALEDRHRSTHLASWAEWRPWSGEIGYELCITRKSPF